MDLRRMEHKDAALIYEWMQNESITKYLRGDFASISLDDVKQYIIKCNNDTQDISFAIVSDTDEYMGTVKLKNIDKISNSAELEICVRQCAMGHGYSWFAMVDILKISFEKYGLDCVYWCVSRNNKRAVRFFDKHNFHETFDVPQKIRDEYKGDDLKWYSFLKGDVIENREEIVGCKIIHIKTIPTVGAGELSFFEGTHDINFDIKRIYYISKVPEGIRRGFHAHKELKQILLCPYGRIQLILENELGREEIELSDPSIAVIIDKPTWREMLWLQKDSVLCVAASDFYDENDYIRSYDEFRKCMEEMNR